LIAGGYYNRMRRTAVAALACLVAAACGGGGSASFHTTGGRSAPTITHTIALELAAQADQVATDLRAGDDCRARDDATQLQHAAADAIANGAVPASLATPLTSSVTTLAQRIVCRPPPEHKSPKHHAHHHGNGDGNGQGNGGD
jgi:hypothetical protein